MPSTVADAIDLARGSLAGLRARGEAIEDEWQYVADLDAAWRERLDTVAAARGAEPLEARAAEAVVAAVAEAASIADPHRAIDWLSTFPSVVLVALGEPG